MSKLIPYEHPDLGAIRAVEIDGKPYVVGVDVARVLEYAKPSQAVIDHCKGIRKLGIPSRNQHGTEVIQATNVIPEGDIYRLIIKAADQSRNQNIRNRAEQFERWIFDEVIPSIRKTGQYGSSPQKAELNILANILNLQCDLEYYESQLQQYEEMTANARQAYHDCLNYRNSLKRAVITSREFIRLHTEQLALLSTSEKG